MTRRLLSDLCSAGYYAVFAMAFGLLGVDIVLRLLLIEKKVAIRWQKPDDVQHESKEQEIHGEKSATEAKIAHDTERAASTTLDQPPRSTAPAAGVALEPVSKDENEREVRQAPGPAWTQRLPPILLLLSSRRLLAALWGCLMQASLLTSFDSTLPIFVRNTFGWNSIGAGLIFLPIVLPSLIGPWIGKLSDRYGPRWLATGGFVLATPVLILLRFVSYDSLRQKVLLCALLFLLGATLNLVLTPLMAEVTYAVEATTAKRPTNFLGKKGAYAQAYALFNMAFAGGCLVGPLVGGLVNQRAGWGATTLTLGCLSAFSALPTVIWTGGSILKKRRKRKESLVVEEG